ncbi:MAG: hypothetical protein HFE04_02980 [Bacilli bacterium]|nr:hypothetical protein [Bacilli bacterium]
MQLNWDLTHLYKNEEEWNKDYKKIEENLKELNTNIKKILYNKEEFKKYLELKIETERIIDRVFSYSKKKVHLNMTLENYKEQMKNVLSLYGKFQVISNEFEKLCIENENKIQEYLKDRELKKYQRHIKLILRKKEHTITSKENLELLANYEKELQDIRNKYQETIMKIGQ